MIAFLEARGAGLLSRSQWLRNIVAGVVVGVVALPLAMAFAIASGAKPEQGLCTAIVASVVVSLFGGSRVQIAGPTGAFVVILAGITARYGVDGLQIATLLAGVILLLLMGAVHRHHRPADARGSHTRSASSQGASDDHRCEREGHGQAGQGRFAGPAGAREFLQGSAACVERTGRPDARPRAYHVADRGLSRLRAMRSTVRLRV